jgi:hypothetical protein
MKFGKHVLFLLLSFAMISAANGDDSPFHSNSRHRGASLSEPRMILFNEITWEIGPETTFISETKPFIGIGYLMKYVMSVNPENFAVSVEAYAGHPSTPVQSASVYNSNDRLISIQSDLLGDDLSLLSCDELKSRLSK